MTYLIHDADPKAIQIAACESDERVAERIAQGYRKVTPDQYRDAWRKQDQRVVPQEQPKVRAIGGWEIGDFWNKQ